MKKILIQKTFVLKLSVFCFELAIFPVFAAASMWHGSVLLYRCLSRIFRRQEFKL